MTMELNIRLFATLKDRAGSDRIRVTLAEEPATAAAVMAAEPVVRVTVEADDAALVQSTLDALAEAVRAAA